MNTMTQRYLLFIFVIGAMMSVLALPNLGLNSAPIPQSFNPNPVNQQITQSAQNVIVTTIQGGVTTTTTMAAINSTSTGAPAQTCESTGGGLLNSLQVSVCNFNIAWKDAFAGLVCAVNNTFNNPLGCSTINRAVGIANALTTTSPSIFDLNGGYSRNISVVQGTNSLLQIFASPITQAITVLIIFLGLGWLAGTFGAGILGNLMAKVGIAVSLFYYINAQLLAFGSIPPLIQIFFNAIIGVPTIVMLYDSVSGGVSH